MFFIDSYTIYASLAQLREIQTLTISHLDSWRSLTHLLYFLGRESIFLRTDVCVYQQRMSMPAPAHAFSLAWVFSGSCISESKSGYNYICLLAVYLSSFVRCLFISFSQFGLGC